MSRVDRALGLARSLVIYHLMPRQQRALRGLYGQFVAAGDLAFDVGAHVGNRTRALAALGCRVVAVEPQPAVAATLRFVAGRSPGVTVVEAAVTRAPGRAALSVSERTPTVSTLADEWREARRQDRDFASVRWNDTVDVETTTLDALIALYGEPAFIKLDIEGGELEALMGLTRAVRVVSFEFLAQALPSAAACAVRLGALADYRFNWSPGESHRLASPEWLGGEALLAQLTSARPSSHGDVYARRLD
jgi:FkbM family methyltransferase